jgi:hypothetical protein
MTPRLRKLPATPSEGAWEQQEVAPVDFSQTYPPVKSKHAIDDAGLSRSVSSRSSPDSQARLTERKKSNRTRGFMHNAPELARTKSASDAFTVRLKTSRGATSGTDSQVWIRMVGDRTPNWTPWFDCTAAAQQSMAGILSAEHSPFTGSGQPPGRSEISTPNAFSITSAWMPLDSSF